MADIPSVLLPTDPIMPSSIQNSSTLHDQSLIDPLCQIATKVLETPGLSVFIILMIIFGVIAVLINCLLFFSVWNVTIFHLNLRICIAHVCFCAVLFCVPCMSKVIGMLRAMINKNPCVLITNSLDCRLQELPRTFGSQALMYACASVTVERLYCSVRYKKPYHGFPIMALVLIPLCYVTPMYNFLRSYSSTNRTSSVAVCENLLTSTIESTKISLSLNVTFTLISLSLAGVLHFWNRRQLSRMLGNRALTHTLAARFQLDQNVQLTQIIGPSAILELFTFLPNYAFLLLTVVGLDLSYETKTIIIQCSYFWKICFCLAYPSFFFLRNSRVRRGLYKILPQSIQKRFCDRKSADGGTTTANLAAIVGGANRGGSEHRAWNPIKMHFEILDKAWALPGVSRKLGRAAAKVGPTDK